jgi:hypothetical protein
MGSISGPWTARAGETITYIVPALDVTESNRVGLIITLVDPEENLQSGAGYRIVLRSGSE